MLSLGWCFQREAAALAGLSLSIGLALARELRQLGGRNIGLKWPNDLLCPAGKLGGILVDLIPQANAGSYAVVGVGINLDDSGLVGMAAGQRVTDLAAQLDGPLPQRSELAASVLTWLAQALARFDQLGFAGDQAEWNTLDVFAGKKISAVVEGEKVSGCGDGADATGCYRVRRDDGSIATLIAGEVSLSLEHPVTGAQKSAP
jgi:BirA family biotin operon repressor/biotin-[acetyl-CoA-carboxylase] ligase